MGNQTLADHGPPHRLGRSRSYSYTATGDPMLVIANHAQAAIAERAIAAVGGRLLQRVAWTDATDLLPRLATTPVLLVETGGVSDAMLDRVLPAVRHAIDTGAVGLVAIAADQIDVVASHLLPVGADTAAAGRLTLLCDPDDAERGAALDAATRKPRPTLQDGLPDGVRSGRSDYHAEPLDTDEQRLKRLTRGIEDLSRLAADLGGGAAATIADRRPGYDSGAPATRGVAAQDVRRLIFRRSQRSKFFGELGGGEVLFEDPAWDILLDLFAAELEGRQVSVSSLCIAAGVAPTTALRWIAKMTELDMLIRHPDPDDKRRAFMTLAPRTSTAMRNYITTIQSPSPPSG